MLVLVEHERGIMRAFDEHLSAVSAGGTARSRTSTTSVTWTAITGWRTWPPVVRLELKIDGLQMPDRGSCSRSETMMPLWLLAGRRIASG